MPDDVEGKPFPDGWEPDDDRGGADEDFASVVFDEAFVKAAEIHEPSAVERLLAAAEARADSDAAARTRARHRPEDDPYDPSEGRDPYAPYGDGGHGDGDARDTYADGVFVGPYGPYGRHGGAMRPYRNSSRWHRPVAWLLAVLMGIGMVAFAFAAVYRGASGSRDGRTPSPAATEVDVPAPGTAATPGTAGGGPSVSAEYTAPAASAQPRTP
ncbi:SCO2584 family spore wall biosynthesis protein [Streptomyces sp. NPDC054863]